MSMNEEDQAREALADAISMLNAFDPEHEFADKQQAFSSGAYLSLRAIVDAKHRLHEEVFYAADFLLDELEAVLCKTTREYFLKHPPESSPSA